MQYTSLTQGMCGVHFTPLNVKDFHLHAISNGKYIMKTETAITYSYMKTISQTR